VADRKAATAHKFQQVNSMDDPAATGGRGSQVTWSKLLAYREKGVNFADATSNNQKTPDS
jgi:hypothetical protein